MTTPTSWPGASDAAATYAEVDSVARRRLNQVFFKKLLIYPTGVGGAELTDALGQVLADELGGRPPKSGPAEARTPL